jgi:quercetin dioxygenase-like cupin family protein
MHKPIELDGGAGMKIGHWDADGDGPLSESTLRQKFEQLGYTVTRYVYPPGTYFPEHTHNMDKIDAVLSGHFRMTTHGESTVLTAGDFITVPRGSVHSAEVVGNEPVISLDAVKIR